MNKYLYLFVVQGKYDLKYEDLCSSENRKEAREDLKSYRGNEMNLGKIIHYRIIKRRIPNPTFK